MYRIGFDAKRLFNNFTGLGNYSRTLLRNLAEYYPDYAYFLYTPKIVKHPETQFFENSPLFNVQTPPPHRRLMWRSWGMGAALQHHKIDLFHGLSHEVPWRIGKTGIPVVVTMHDLIFKHYPEQYPPFDRAVYDAKFRYACKASQHIIAISESTKRDVCEFYHIPPEKVTVIYQSCSPIFQQEKSEKSIAEVLKRYHIPSDYLFYVGSLIPRKNLLGIVEALGILRPEERLPLVIVGQGERYKKKVLERARQLGIEPLLYFIEPAFQHLPQLYQQADALVYPSFYEGFGIPIIEALFSETPVISSNVSSLPEAAGPDSLLVNPHQPEELAQAIRRILNDSELRRHAIKEGYEYAQRFNGEPLTQELMALYERFL